MEAQWCRRSLATLIISLSSQSSSVFRKVCGPSNISSGPFSAQARCADCQYPQCICVPRSDYRRPRAFSDLKDYLESLMTLGVAAMSPRPIMRVFRKQRFLGEVLRGPRPSHRASDPQLTGSHTLRATGLNAIELFGFSSHRFKPWYFDSHRAFS